MEKDMEYYIKISNEVMLKNLNSREALPKKLVDQYLDSGKDHICIIASGSSLNAAMAAELFMNQCMGNNVVVMSPTEYIDYRKENVKDYFKIVISQSGCSTNIIEAVKDMAADENKPAVLTGNLEGDIKKYSDNLIEYGVGNESIDYVTLGMTVLIQTLILFVLETGKRKGFLSEEYNSLAEELETCCIANREMYYKAIHFTETFYKDLLKMDRVIIVADGANMGIAREAALKFGETLKIPALYYESEEYIHGPNMQLTPEYAVFFIDTNRKHNRMFDIFEATGYITEHTYFVTDKEMPESERIIKVTGNVRSELTPLYTAVPFQYISAHVTKEKNNFECHPLFGRFEEKIHCKTDDYDEIMENKKLKAEEE